MIAAENQYFSLPAALRSPAIGQSSMNPGQVFRYLQAPLAIRPPI
ncbi:MAG: hypothetical protein QOF70_206, partial [Acetobacteraceae bacterium]|nr:hypothetical protein [Acetobacteraceae bacterium]